MANTLKCGQYEQYKEHLCNLMQINLFFNFEAVACSVAVPGCVIS